MGVGWGVWSWGIIGANRMEGGKDPTYAQASLYTEIY
jgi:hypothetical protein